MKRRVRLREGGRESKEDMGEIRFPFARTLLIILISTSLMDHPPPPSPHTHTHTHTPIQGSPVHASRGSE